ncbi:MAG: MFS transporter, partial [Rubrobacteraceae bacterium]
GIGGSYWTTFFPAVVVMGFGMSLVIAPLTTTALNAVEGQHSGLASGVNNAVSRTASLLSIAVLGIFVFTAFSNTLDSRLSKMDLPPTVVQQMDARKVDLGATQAPQGIDVATKKEINQAVDESFVAGFRTVMFIAAGLALASALVSALIIEGKPAPPEQTGQTGTVDSAETGGETAPA